MAWLCAGLLALGAIAANLPGVAWAFDLVANLGAQLALFAVASAPLLAFRRRWGPAVLSCLAAAAAAYPVLSASRAPGGPGRTSPIKILVFNSLASSADTPAALETIHSSQADIVALSEPSAGLLDAARAGGPLCRTYPHAAIPDRAAGGYMVVLSRWPQRPLGGLEGRDRLTPFRGARAMIIDAPSGPLGFVLVHPESPRGARRWAEGNALVEQTVGVVIALREVGLPVVVSADLNSAPGGWRSRRLCAAAGLARAKPLAAAAGTYPAALPWPLSVAIDDAWVSDDLRVARWRVLSRTGSDHRAVLVELAATAPGPAR